jgi:hypothetical protein
VKEHPVKRLMLCLAFLLTAASAHAAPGHAGANAVPAWFREDPAQPYAIFDAPKHLSTPSAVVYLGAEWTTLGGRLEDAQGRPLPSCHVSINDFGGIRGYSARLCTDADGYFLIYSPYSLRGCTFSAAPGYPNTSAGIRYAASQNDVKTCVASLLYQAADRAFYRLVADSHNRFSLSGLEAFSRDLAADLAKRQNETPTLPDRGTIGGSETYITTAFPLRLVDSEGHPLKQALIRLGDFGLGVALTDADGEASFTETVAASTLKKSAYRRTLIINAPGGSFGPVTVSLDPRRTTTITLDKPATVEGQVRNADGLPDLEGLTLSYVSAGGAVFTTPGPDGSFVFPRVVPGQPFRIILDSYWTWQDTPTVPVEGPMLTLRPGEMHRGVQLQAVQPAALRGIVTDTEGHPVPVGEATRYPDEGRLTLILPDAPAGRSYGGPIGTFGADSPRQVIYEGTGGWLWGDPGPKFGFSGLGAGPFRLRVESERYQPYLSEPIRLAPGELRFVKIVLHHKAAAQKSP